MAAISFNQVHRATARALSRFERVLPILVRLGLLLLFCWILYDLWVSNVIGEGKFFLTVLGLLFLLPVVGILVSTYVEFEWGQDAEPPPKMPGLWPFVLVNLQLVLLVAAIAKAKDTAGLLGFTQRWAERIETLLKGWWAR